MRCFTGRPFGGGIGLAGATRLALDGGRLGDSDCLLVKDFVDEIALLGEGVRGEAYFLGDFSQFLQRLAGELSDIISLHCI